MLLVSISKNWCLHSWLWNNSRHFFPSGEAWLCHAQSLQTSAASIGALLAFPSLGCSSEPFGKDVSTLGFLSSINRNIITSLLVYFLLPYLSICPALCFLVNWYCWCDVKVMNFLLRLWGFLSDLAVFFLCPISSCQPWLSTIQYACPRLPICLCLSYSFNPAFFLHSHQFWTLWY